MKIPNQVTVRPTGADCEAVKTFTAPKSPDVYSWIFPTGCFTYCDDIKASPYVIGPIPEFNGGYQYDLDGYGIAGGVGVVSDLQFSEIGLIGGLTLTLNNQFCNITTDFLDITAEDCEECDDFVQITEVDKIEDPTGFVYYNIVGGVIYNPIGYPITVTLSSLHGSFIPSVIAIPPGGGFNFANNPVMFIPFSPLQGPVLLEYVVNINGGDESKIFCLGAMNVNMEALSGFTGGGIVQMKVIPNPVASQTQVHYVVEDVPEYNGGILKLYSLNGSLIQSKKVTETKGQTRFDMTNLASGTYVIVFFSHGQRIGQQIIIKE